MANCYKCGKQIPDQARFCPYCGGDQQARVAQKPASTPAQNQGVNSGANSGAATGAAANIMPDKAAGGSTSPASGPVTGSHFSPAAGPAQNPNVGATPGAGQIPGSTSTFSGATAQVPGSIPPSGGANQFSGSVPPSGGISITGPSFPLRRSPLSRAWEDWKASPSKWMIALKIALLQMVPAAGGIVGSGYATHWGRECALGRHELMNEKIIRPGVLDAGLYSYGVNLIWACISMVLFFVVSGILGALRLGWLGLLLLIVYWIASTGFFAILSMMAAICGRVRDGMNVSRAWAMVKESKRFGEVMSAVLVPGILAGLLAIVVCLLWGLIMGVGAAMGIGGAALSYSYYYDMTAMITSLIGTMIGFIVSLIPMLFCLSFFSISAQVISMRAIGYWLADFNPASWPEYQQNAMHYASKTL